MSPDPQRLHHDHSAFAQRVLSVKVRLLSAQRALLDLIRGVRAWPHTPPNPKAVVLASRNSALWTRLDEPGEWVLTAGKVENLRVVARALNGLTVPAGELMSFWAQVGRPSERRGFVVGREVQQGCVLPTIAGGICQVSNALYAAALEAGLEVVERHAHSQRVAGSEGAPDATLKWRYLDLRLRAPFAWRLEVSLSEHTLHVSILSSDPKALKGRNALPVFTAPPPLSPPLPLGASRSCYSCEEVACDQHKRHHKARQTLSLRAQGGLVMVLGAPWPEHERLLIERVRREEGPITLLCLASHAHPRLGRRWGWGELERVLKARPPHLTTLKTHPQSALSASLSARWGALRGENPFKRQLHTEASIARALAPLIPLEATTLLCTQELAPALARLSVFGGRRVELLLTRLPLGSLQARLDAHAERSPERSPERASLTDYRAPSELIELEVSALRRANTLSTPHLLVARTTRELLEESSLGNQTTSNIQQLPWCTPSHLSSSLSPSSRSSSKEETQDKAPQNIVLFPASLMSRRGADLLAQVWSMLTPSEREGGELRVMRGQEEADLKARLNAPLFQGEWSRVACVFYPAPVMITQPRLLLRALQHNIPVITTEAAGLPSQAGLKLIPSDDLSAMKVALMSTLSSALHKTKTHP